MGGFFFSLANAYATLSRTMSSSAEKEPAEPQELTPISRYYSDVYYKSTKPGDMLIAIDKLLELNHISLSDDEQQARTAEVFPGYDDYTVSAAEMYDRYLTLPLALVGPTVDREWKLQDTKVWYSETLGLIRSHAKQYRGHDTQCLDVPSFAYSHRCEHSGHCPYIFTAKYMERQMFDENFSLPPYDTDLVVTQGVAVAKERLAYRYGYRSERQIEGLIREYEARVREELGRRAVES